MILLKKSSILEQAHWSYSMCIVLCYLSGLHLRLHAVKLVFWKLHPLIQFTYIEISSLAAKAMAKHSHNININETEELRF
jgi:hypothetical protein